MFARLRSGVRSNVWRFLALAVILSASCGQTVELKQALQIADLSGGWHDAGVVDGKNKLVPSLSFRIRKPANVELRSLSINVIFKRVSPDTKEEEDLDEVFLQRVEFSEGDQTPLLTIRPEHGYTGDPGLSRADMLQHSGFRDARAVVFARQSSTTWVDLLRYDVPRTLLTK
jgi:hypothetical protein